MKGRAQASAQAGQTGRACGRDLMIEQTDLLGRLERIEKSKGGWTARCPAHDDQESSLRIRHEDEVRWRLECRAGCTSEEVAGAIGIAVPQLQPDQVFRYRYDDSYEVVRIGPKDFRHRRRDDGGAWTFDTTGVEPPLYRLQALQESRPRGHGQPVIVVEREDYVNRLRTRFGDRMPATCCAGGLGKWEATHIEQVKDAGVEQVAVIPDDDAESRADAQAVAYACHAAGLDVRVVDIPGPVRDVSAYLDEHTESDLAALIEAVPRFTGPVPTRLSEVSAEPVSWLWPGWIPEGSVTVLDGVHGLGKTLITLDLAARVSTGHTMPDGRSGPGKPAAVVLVTGDDVTRTVMPRLDVAGADMTRIDHLPRDGDRLPTDADLGAIFGAVVAAKARLVVLDPLLPIVSPLRFAMVVDAGGVSSIAWSTTPHVHETSCRPSRPRRKGRPALDAAVEFLEDLLADGPLSVAEVARAADSAGIAMPTLRRAKSMIEVESRKQGQPESDNQAWMWVLPRK